MVDAGSRSPTNVMNSSGSKPTSLPLAVLVTCSLAVVSESAFNSSGNEASGAKVGSLSSSSSSTSTNIRLFLCGRSDSPAELILSKSTMLGESLIFCDIWHVKRDSEKREWKTRLKRDFRN